MTKIIWMSDPHFQVEGLTDHRVRLAAAIAHANQHHNDANFTIISGDLAGGETPDNYAAMAPILAKLAMPVYPMIGNHDDREGARAFLPLPVNTIPDFIQFSIDTPDGTMICLDTHKTGSHAGELCAARRAWLDQTLGDLGDRPAYIFMHHPPMALGLPAQDEISLDDGDTFLDLLGTHNNVKHLFMGHVHRPTCGTIRGIPFATIGALSFQAPAPHPAWDWDNFVPAKEAPHYGVLHISDGNVTLQYTQFYAYETGIEI